MFDFILRWFGKGKPKEDTSPTLIEETGRVVTPSSTPQADSALQAKLEELTARLARTKKALEKAEEENEELEDKLKREKREA